jgi:predicted anti-sigma-YlaC factor YlaD
MSRSRVGAPHLVDELPSVEASLAMTADSRSGLPLESRLALNRRRRRVRLALAVLAWAAIAVLLVVLGLLTSGAMV